MRRDQTRNFRVVVDQSGHYTVAEIEKAWWELRDSLQDSPIDQVSLRMISQRCPLVSVRDEAGEAQQAMVAVNMVMATA